MSGNDEMISGTKIEPLASPTKRHAPTEHVGGSVGEDEIVDSSRIGPMKSGNKVQPQAHAQANPGGSTGTNETIGSVNIEPLHSKMKDASKKN
ncbi:hypothetical protein TWF696_000817 [Orbilia brochopaga]|uniref:Uncharacterized protein n=1 Tax=Orbilia brochopaga TaxID=3140254 RepID=A0AAV9VF20_9PEZI